MKPMIKKQSHYSLLLMRDDSSVRTFRVKGSSITAFFSCLLLLWVGGALGVWGGLHYWNKYRVLKSNHALQERELSEVRLQLERYVNYDTLLAASNSTLPLAKNEEIGTGEPRAHNATLAPLSRNATLPAFATNATRTAPASTNATATGNATAPRNATSGAEPLSRKPLLRISGDTSPLRISEFDGRPVGTQRMRVRYDLSTASSDGQTTVSGKARYFAAFTNGTQVELPVSEASDSRFAISRMKPMDANLRLPPGYDARQVSRIQLAIDVDNGATYWDAYHIAE